MAKLTTIAVWLCDFLVVPSLPASAWCRVPECLCLCLLHPAANKLKFVIIPNSMEIYSILIEFSFVRVNSNKEKAKELN